MIPMTSPTAELYNWMLSVGSNITLDNTIMAVAALETINEHFAEDQIHFIKIYDPALVRLLLTWIMSVIYSEFFADVVSGPTWGIMLSHISPLILMLKAVECLMIRFRLSHDYGFLMTWNIEAPTPPQYWFSTPNLEERGYSRLDQRYGSHQIVYDYAYFCGHDTTIYNLGDPNPQDFPNPEVSRPTTCDFQVQFSRCIADIPHFDPFHTRYNSVRPFTRFENFHLLPRPEEQIIDGSDRTRIIFTSSLIRRYILVLQRITSGRRPGIIN